MVLRRKDVLYAPLVIYLNISGIIKAMKNLDRKIFHRKERGYDDIIGQSRTSFNRKHI